MFDWTAVDGFEVFFGAKAEAPDTKRRKAAENFIGQEQG